VDFGHATEQYLVAAKNLIMKYFFIIFLTQVFSLNHSIETKSLFSFKGEFFDGTPMGIPMNIESFSDGSFVLHENETQDLKKFDHTGRFIEKLSRRGRGPGEFLDIDNIFINQNDELLVLDHKQLKFSVLKQNEDVEEHRIFKSRPRAREIHQKSNGEYILASIKYSEIGRRESGALFYEIDERFNIKDKEFGFTEDYTLEEIGSLPHFVMRGGSGLTDSSILTNGEDLLVAPMFYTGRLIRYNSSSNYSTFNQFSFKNFGIPYKEYESSSDNFNFNIMHERGLNLVSNRTLGSRIFYHFNRSLGLFKLNTGEILHFAQIKRGEEADLIVEFINEEGSKVIGTQTLRNIGDIDVKENTSKKDNHSRIDLVFHHMDKNNRLYVSRMGKDFAPELHVVQIKLNK